MRPRPHRTRRRPTDPTRRPPPIVRAARRPQRPVPLLAFKKYASVCRCTIVRHPDCDTAGSIHADNVIAPDKPKRRRRRNLHQTARPVERHRPAIPPRRRPRRPQHRPRIPIPRHIRHRRTRPRIKRIPQHQPHRHRRRRRRRHTRNRAVRHSHSPPHQPQPPDSCNSSTRSTPYRCSCVPVGVPTCAKRRAASPLTALHPIPRHPHVVRRRRPRQIHLTRAHRSRGQIRRRRRRRRVRHRRRRRGDDRRIGR